MDYSEDKSCMSRKSQESISCRAISFLTAIYIFKKDSIMLGGCANVLNSIYTMGGKVYVTGVIGADNIGKRFLAELHQRQIAANGIIIDKKSTTTIKTRVV